MRAAIFDMIQAQAGSVGGLPPGCRWLDLFAGTGEDRPGSPLLHFFAAGAALLLFGAHARLPG